jgi:hypothetical protein
MLCITSIQLSDVGYIHYTATVLGATPQNRWLHSDTQYTETTEACNTLLNC